MDWWIYALISSFALAGFSELNRKFQMNPFHLGFCQLAISALLLTPYIATLPWPTESIFYIAGGINGIAMAISTVIFFNLSAKYNGRVAMLYMPFKLFAAFILWLVMDKFALESLLANPARATVIVFCLLLTVWALLSLYSRKANTGLLYIVTPIGLMYASLDIMVKYVLPNESFFEASLVFAYTAFVSGTLSMGACLYLTKLGKSQKKQQGLVKASFILAILGVISFICLLSSLSAAPNPAYTSAVLLLSSVWIMFYHRCLKIPDNQNPRAGFAIVVSAFGLIIMTG